MNRIYAHIVKDAKDESLNRQDAKYAKKHELKTISPGEHPPSPMASAVAKSYGGIKWRDKERHKYLV